MIAHADHAEQRARDALSFDPLPPSPWIIVTARGIEIATRYSEPLSHILRDLPGSRWDAMARCWRYPFMTAPAIRKSMAEIDRLASEAREGTHVETLRREAERLESVARRTRDDAERSRQRAAAVRKSLRREYLVPVAGRPKYHLSMEAIGDDTYRQLRATGMPPPFWVAQIFASNGGGGWVRDFLPARRDYSNANSAGSRGTILNYVLDEGPIYEIKRRVSWQRAERGFLRIVDGQPVPMTADEVSACLEN